MDASAILQFLPMLLNMTGGQNEERGSTYSEGAQGGLNDLLAQIKGRGGVPDITQDQGYQNGQNWMNGLFNDPEFFNSFEAPLQRQFQENTVPDLANRFAGMGSGGSLGSTGFRNQLAREGSNLSTNIAALRGGMQQQAIPQMLGYAQQPVSNMMSMMQQAFQPTQNTYQGATPGFLGNFLSSLTGGLAQGGGQKLGEYLVGGSKGGAEPNAGHGVLSRGYS